ncbi:MAG TPA: Hsp20/alpha crystallin family protein [Candidatus Polarisedimenticolaceae bacterium]|nr:Hsp20/alpha crystallin family protein [Candidatus Polarisedimenticolaceae bacterium]
MAVERWDPVRDLRHLRERVDSLFQDVLGRAGGAGGAEQAGSSRPPVDAWEEGDRYQVRVDLPGVGPGDVNVEIEEGVLHVRGERREGSVPRDGYLRSERPRGRFALSMALPQSVDAQGIEARQRDGVLEITLRKKRDDRAGRVRIALR